MGGKIKLSITQSTFEPQSVRTKGHSSILIALIILDFLLFCVTAFINAASSIPGLSMFSSTTTNSLAILFETSLILEIFKNQTGAISNQNEVNITPAGWTFSTW
jgi:hypothetical protein